MAVEAGGRLRHPTRVGLLPLRLVVQVEVPLRPEAGEGLCGSVVGAAVLQDVGQVRRRRSPLGGQQVLEARVVRRNVRMALLPDDDVLHGPPVGDESLDGLVPYGAVAAVHRDVVMQALEKDNKKQHIQNSRKF